MRDPEPGNISGEKVQRHVFKHEINWGYVAIGIAAIYVASRLFEGTEAAAHGDDEGKNDYSPVSGGE